ncbi:hypothetical protein FOMPIDRAFT_1095199, partial [Fomitopsis schrenkii]
IDSKRVAAICSDSTIVTLKSRREINKMYPTIFDLRDCCHHLHNLLADISKLEEFKWPLDRAKKILAHVSKSTHSRALLREEDEDGDTLLALKKIGKTRFGSTWSSADSILPAMPRIRELVIAKEIKFKLELGLLQYTTIGEPICRSLWSLEASDANASDVFVFFTAIGASLKELFAKDQDETGIPVALANKVVNIFNDRYDEFFFHSEIYFVAFALDP